jgi:two-component system cell cycle response regulator
VLQEHGYLVSPRPAADALRARLAGGDEPLPDLMLLDLYMPTATGAAARRGEARAALARRAGAHASSAPVEESTVRRSGSGRPTTCASRSACASSWPQARRSCAPARARTTRETLRRTQEELERARNDAENRRKLVDILHEVTGDLAAAEIYHLLARRVARALSVSHCAVILAGANDAEGVVATAFENPKLQKGTVPIAAYPEVQRAIETGAPVLLEDIASSPLYAGTRGPVGLDGAEVPVRSAMALPFAIDHAQRGVFLLRRTREQPPLTAEDVAFAEAVIGAAVAWCSARR